LSSRNITLRPEDGDILMISGSAGFDGDCELGGGGGGGTVTNREASDDVDEGDDIVSERSGLSVGGLTILSRKLVA